ncbi:uncharacterized protein [Rutidosis leptorrhynchoides]|uniref:uncharacterized protein n=1 Tax=Rutidosis leptorrhynchoides TaxID=125765 RepID=UPI003A997270
MNDQKCLETLDRTLRDIYDSPEIPFGSLTFILGGDFCQTLHVMKRCGKREILNASIANSYLWKKFTIITLEENMRLHQPNLSTIQKEDNANFEKWLLQIGNGNIGVPDKSDPHNASWVEIPERFCIPNGEAGLSQLISFIYDESMLRFLDANYNNKQSFVQKMRRLMPLTTRFLQA